MLNLAQNQSQKLSLLLTTHKLAGTKEIEEGIHNVTQTSENKLIRFNEWQLFFP